MSSSAILLIESRIHGNMYVRFGGRYGETYHRKVARRSMPSLLTVVDKDIKDKIKYDDYKKLSDQEKQRYSVYPKMQVYSVFNVDQTNMKEARPELYAKIEEENQFVKPKLNGEGFSFPIVDKMIEDNSWVCPIELQHQDRAYYSILNDKIVMPEKAQFVDGESFVGVLFHEMTYPNSYVIRTSLFN